MNCFSCGPIGRIPRTTSPRRRPSRSLSCIVSTIEHEKTAAASTLTSNHAPAAHRFSFRELALATRNFREGNLIGEGGFGKVYKGWLETGQVIAVKQLNREGMQGSKEFLVEVLMLIILHHPNLVSLIGYCAEGEQRALVYEYMEHGSLEKHLFDLGPDKEALGWNTMIKIALGAAKGITYLHDMANPPVIYRDLKSANILLDNDFNPKLSDFGLAKLAPVGDKTHVSTRVMGTYGYCAPDYAMSGKLTLKSDVYSFGVVLLELITGRRAYDFSKEPEEQNLITWSRPYLSNRTRFTQLADPLLCGRYPIRAFYQLAIITSMCLQDLPHSRPVMRDVACALEHVASQPYVGDPDHEPHSIRPPLSAEEEDTKKSDSSSQLSTLMVEEFMSDR